DVDHAARRPAVLGLEAAALDLDFADEFEGDRVGAAELPLAHVGDFDAIKDERVLGAAGSVDLDAANSFVAGLRLGAHTRRRRQDRVKITPLGGVVDELLSEVSSSSAGSNI